MKKILAIWILAISLSGCATTQQIADKTTFYKGMTKENIRDIFYWSTSTADPFLGCFKEYYQETGKEIIAGKNKELYFVFENVTRPRVQCKYSDRGNGSLLLWTANYNEALKAAKEKPKKIVKKTKPKKNKPKENYDDIQIVPASSGTGFFVSEEGHIVTNNHVIDQCKNVKVSFDSNEYDAQILASDKTNDLAIIKANINQKDFFNVSDKDATLLQDIIVAGYPLGKRVSAAIKTHKGSVTALAGYGDNYSNFQTDATINQGNSGGPVLDLKGNIVGVAVALLSVEAGQNIFFAIKSSTLKTFANSNNIFFKGPSVKKMSNEELGQKITNSTVYLECYMTLAQIKRLIVQEENRKAFFKKFR